MCLKLEIYLSIWLYQFYFRYYQIYGISSNSVTLPQFVICVLFMFPTSRFNVSNVIYQLYTVVVENFEVVKTGLIVGNAFPQTADFEISTF